MVFEDPRQPGLKVVASGNDELEAAMIAGCLQSAGIHCTYRQSVRGVGGARPIYVEDVDYELAREVLDGLASTDEPVGRRSSTADTESWGDSLHTSMVEAPISNADAAIPATDAFGRSQTSGPLRRLVARIFGGSVDAM